MEDTFGEWCWELSGKVPREWKVKTFRECGIFRAIKEEVEVSGREAGC